MAQKFNHKFYKIILFFYEEYSKVYYDNLIRPTNDRKEMI